MKLTTQKRLAAEVMKCSPKRAVFDTERLPEIKEAITKIDIRSLVKDKAITKIPKRSVSRGRARFAQIQKRSGRRRGHGSRKGKENARNNKKLSWISHVRAQRLLLKKMKDKEAFEVKDYRNLYNKVKGGFFRSRKHLKLYIEERKLAKKK